MATAAPLRQAPALVSWAMLAAAIAMVASLLRYASIHRRRAALALGAGLDARIGPFVAGYVLVLAIAAPLLAANADHVTRRLRAIGSLQARGH